jgi:outer membrane receptor protein involved in Fe transport
MNINKAIQWIAAAAIAVPAMALAQDGATIDIEIPQVILEDTSGSPDFEEETLDLANVVQAAARGVTTVQEAPAIITVVTAEEIKDRGFTTLMDVADSVPGWLRSDGFYGQFPFVNTRGTTQGMLFLVNSVSMFDPFFNAPSIWRINPMETVKRIEFVTGPGGVLWGANSYMGIMNVITKDAGDIDGVEASVSFGDGPGDRGMFKGYVMAGLEDFADDLDIMAHAGFQTYQGPKRDGTLTYYGTAAPNPTGPTYTGPLMSSDQKRSWLFNLSTKINYKDFSLYVSSPFVTSRQAPQAFNGEPTLKDRATDSLPECQPDAIEAAGGVIPQYCADPFGYQRDHELIWFDRTAVAEYRSRFADGRAGLSAKVYGTQFVRNFSNLAIQAPQVLDFPLAGTINPGGTAISFDSTNYRVGGNIDGDVELPGNIRLLYGTEIFYDFFGDSATGAGSAQGKGILAKFVTPDPATLGATGNRQCPAQPLMGWDPADPAGGVDGEFLDYAEGCPLTHAFLADRTTMGVYTNANWRPTKKLAFDGGIRLQAAPEALGDLDYGLETIFSGAMVYNFAKNWYVKLNYAEGFRAPVFNNNSNGEAIQFAGRDLDNEGTQAYQAEVNARLFRGVRRIRELTVRADYSYTKINSLIQILDGQYFNTPERAVHSGELLGKLYIEGGHRVELGYTYLRMNMADRGKLASMPEHWFNIAGVFNVVPEVLQAATRMRIMGAFEDYNELVEHRPFELDDRGLVVQPGVPTFPGCTLVPGSSCQVIHSHELVKDRIPPSAVLTLGLTYTGIENLELALWAHNAFNARYYSTDLFNDLAGGNSVPSAYEDFRFNLNATYKY